MAQIKINIGAIIGLNPTVISACDKVSAVKSSFNSTRSQIDGRVLNRNNLGNRMANVLAQLSDIENRIIIIRRTVEKGANNYNRTENFVVGMKDSLIGNIRDLGIISMGLGAAGGSEMAKQASNKIQPDKKEESDSTFEKILKDDWKIEGSLHKGKSQKDGSVFGIGSSGSAEGDVIGGSIKTKSKASWTPEKGNAGAEKDFDAEGHLAKGALKGNVGLLGGEIGGTVGAIGASGKIGATILKDGKFSPTLDAKLKAEAAAAKGNAEVKIGTDEYNGHIKGKGTLLGAEAEAGANVGVITEKDEATGAVKKEIGVKAKVGAEAYVAQGEVSGGITVFGIKIDAGVSGKLGGAGVAAEGKVTTGGISGKIGAGLGLGAGIKISIDWSNFSLWN